MLAIIRTLVTISVWILFVFGLFCMVDGLIALILGKPCWIVRLVFGPVALVFSSLLSFIQGRIGEQIPQLKVLATIGCWILFIAGCICLVLGTFYRFTQFDDFKLWQGAMSLGLGTLTLSGIIAFIRYKLD